MVYYQSGIGGKDELSILQKGFESGFGAGLISNIRDAYGFICNNYDYDDEIYITGFSRGAYTARSVAGLIGKVGILTQSGLKLFYEAFDYYRSSNKEKGKPLECPVTEEVSTSISMHSPYLTQVVGRDHACSLSQHESSTADQDSCGRRLGYCR